MHRYADRKSSLLPDDYKGSVFKILLKSEDKETRDDVFSKLVEIMRDPATEQPHRLSVFRTLGQVNDMKLKKEVLDMTIVPTGEPDAIKLQDFMYPMIGVAASSKEGSELAFTWMRSEWSKIKARVDKGGGSLLQSAVTICCRGKTAKRAAEVVAFFADKDTSSIKRSIDQCVESTRVSAN